MKGGLKKLLLVVFVIALTVGLVACGSEESAGGGEGGNVVIEKIFMRVGENKLEVALEKNSSVDALVEILAEGDITYTANDYGGFEKVGSIGQSLPTNHAQMTATLGDVVLYGSDNVVVFYGSNSWAYTKLGKISGYSSAQLRGLLGEGTQQIIISLT